MLLESDDVATSQPHLLRPRRILHRTAPRVAAAVFRARMKAALAGEPPPPGEPLPPLSWHTFRLPSPPPRRLLS